MSSTAAMEIPFDLMSVGSSSCASSRRESIEDSAAIALSSSSGIESNSSLSPPVVSSKTKKKRRKKRPLAASLSCSRFSDVYYLTGDVLGEGSTGRVETCINMNTDVEFAVKIISKASWTFSRAKVLKEVELYYLCQGQSTIIQLVEYFEEPENFYLIFEKMHGGPLLDQIQSRVHFTEDEAALIVRDLASALCFLHSKGIAHRDLKPENVLCVSADAAVPVKLCDFDLCSSVHQTISTPLLQSPVGSAEYMAPEVVSAFSVSSFYDYQDDDDELTYDKRCDLWSLGIITYILLCGYLPFSAGRCTEGEECTWNSGGECLRCQRALFQAIQGDSLVFPEQHWASVSEEARDLISRLLVKDAAQRLDAASILSHPWLQRSVAPSCGPSLPLETPSVLRRQTSVKELSEFASTALSMKRHVDESELGGSKLLGSRKLSMPAKMYHPQAAGDVDSATAAASRKISCFEPSLMHRQTSLILAEQEEHGLYNYDSYRFEF